MKKTLGLALIGGLMALGSGQSQAQTSNTFTLQTLNVTLSGFQGGSNNNATAVKINNKSLISTLTSALGTSNAPSNARLQIGNNITDGTTAFLITSGSGKNISAIDVTPFFSFGTLAGPLTRGKTSYFIDSFSFGGPIDTNGVALTSMSFTVQGFSTVNDSSGAFNSQVNGTGDNNGSPMVLKGTISAGAISKQVTINISGGGGGGGGGGTNGTNTVSMTLP